MPIATSTFNSNPIVNNSTNSANTASKQYAGAGPGGSSGHSVMMATDLSDSASDISYLEGLLESQGQLVAENMLYNATEAQKARDFSAEQAQLNRDWQERLSNTSYTRAVADLQRAGLNPILAYQQGGASTPTGSSAQTVSASSNNVGGDTLSSLINSFSNLISSGADLASVFTKLSASKTSKTSR